MRIVPGLLFVIFCCLNLAACTTAGQGPKGLPEGPSAFLKSSSRTPVQSANDPAFASSMPLVLRNEENHSYEVHFVDPGTGEAIPGSAPIILGRSTYIPPYPRSTNGLKLAAIESNGKVCEPYAGGVACRASADLLHLVDLQTRQHVTTALPVESAFLPAEAWAGPLSFSPDAAHLALVQNRSNTGVIAIYDVETGALVAKRVLGYLPSHLVYVRDGTALAVYGQPTGSPSGLGKPEAPKVKWVDALTLNTLWEESLEEVAAGEWCLEQCRASHGEQVFVELRPAVVPAHDGSLLYIVHADEARLTTVDFAAQTVHSVETWTAGSWMEQLLTLTSRVAKAKGPVNGATKVALLSPDGKHLYVASQTMDPIYDTDGQWQGVDTLVDLQVLDVQNGRVIASRELDIPEPWITLHELSFMPDGDTLALNGFSMSNGAQWAEVVDARNLEKVTRPEWRVAVVRCMDGLPIIAATRYAGDMLRTREMAVLDPHSFDVVDSWTVDGFAAWLTQ